MTKVYRSIEEWEREFFPRDAAKKARKKLEENPEAFAKEIVEGIFRDAEASMKAMGIEFGTDW